MATGKNKKEPQRPIVLKKPAGATPRSGVQAAKVTKPDSSKNYFELSLIIIISFIAYLPVLSNGFVNWDDDHYIQNNPLIHTINLKEIFTGFVMGNYHPLTMLIYSIEYHFFGLNAKGFHSVNLLIHLINVILVFRAVLLLSDKRGVALIASLLFGIHPMHVESVAWASELKDLLYVFFFLASYNFYLEYLKNRLRKLYFYCLLLFLLSLFSKAMAASLPVVLLLTDYFRGRKINRSNLIEKAPFFALSVIFGVVAVFAQRSWGAIYKDHFTIPEHTVFAVYGFITYLIKLVLPVNQCALYPYPINSGEALPVQYYGYLILFIALVALVFYSLRFTKKIFFGMGFFAITVFLVLQLLPVGGAIMADRYSYLPSVGIFYLAGEGIVLLWNKRIANQSLRIPAMLLLGGGMVFYSVKTYAQCNIWNNSLSLWNDVMKQYQTIYIAYYNRGRALTDEKRYEEAINDYNNAIALRHNVSDIYMNRGIALSELKRYDEGLKDFNVAIELKPDNAEAFYNRGCCFEKMENGFDKAIQDYSKAIQLQPDLVNAYRNRGIVFCKLKKYDDGLQDFNKAIKLEPDYAITYYNKAFAEYYLGQTENACGDFQRAITLGSKEAGNAYLNLCH